MANFVTFTSPVGILNMDYVVSYNPSLDDGVYGIALTMGNGAIKTAVYESTAVQAQLVHNNLTFIANDAGVAGNAITVAFVNGGLNQPLSIVVTGTDIVVNVATDGSGVVTSTEADILAVLSIDVNVTPLIGTILTGDGATVAVAIIATALSGGADDTSEATRDAFIGTIDTAFLM